MEFFMLVRLAPFFLLFLIGGCAASLDTPSLAVRPAEAGAALEAARPAAVATPIALPEIIPLETAIVARVEASINVARASAAPFAKALESARTAAANAAGAPVSSEPWVAAQVAISRLERTREATANALAEVDSVRRELVAGGTNFDRKAFAAMQDIIVQIDTKQRAQVAELLRGLKAYPD